MIAGRKDCRSGELRCDPHTEAEALYCQGSHAEATRLAIAEAMDVNPSTLANWLDPHHHSLMPSERRDQVLRLTDDHQAYARFIASRQGLVVYDPTDARGRNVTRMVSEFGDVLKALDEGTADGRWTADEARRLQCEADELHAAIDAQVHEALRAAGLEPDQQIAAGLARVR